MPLPKNRQFRAPVGWSRGLEDLHDYLQRQPKRRLAARSEKPDGTQIVVTDDWPEEVPIGDAELRIIESGLQRELDALFGPLP